MARLAGPSIAAQAGSTSTIATNVSIAFAPAGAVAVQGCVRASGGLFLY